MLNFINKHKGLSMIIGLSLILFIIMLVIFISLFFGNGKDTYGNRLDGIEEVKLSNDFLKELKNELKDKEEVIDANVRLQGKIVYIVLNLDPNTNIETAKNLSTSTLEKFSEEELDFYDISYLIKWVKETEEGTETSAIEGYKHPNKDSITWMKS